MGGPTMGPIARMTAAVAALIAAPAAAQAPAAPAQDLVFLDYLEDFSAVWQQTSKLPDAERATAFRTAFAKILPGFYDPERVKDFIPPDRYNELILKGLKQYPEKRAGIERVQRNFAELARPARREFEAMFGPMRGYPAVLIVHSFGEFDGGTRELADGMHLMFGADMIAELYNDRPIKPFVQHELFHLLHSRTFPDCDAIYCNLWQEGLATYVSATLNPGADDAALGMTIPAPIRPAVEANKAGAICAVRERLDSDKPDDYAPLFYGNRKLEGFPARMGYYIGYLVAQDIARTHDLKQMAAMTPAQVRPLIVQSLDAMANCAGMKTERG
jgi:hypothetical protein